MNRTLSLALLAASMARLIQAQPHTNTANDSPMVKRDYPVIPDAIPANAPDDELRYQPAMDFDKDSCYNVAMIDAGGHPIEDMDVSDDASDCRFASYLEEGKNNVYSRKSCKGDWCGYMYTYYFPKDYSDDGYGTQGDMESVVVWVYNDAVEYEEIKYVTVTTNEGTKTEAFSGLRAYDYTHPKVVYHKEGSGRHSLRFAYWGDDLEVENATGEWYRGSLVSWCSLDQDVRDMLNAPIWTSDMAYFPLADWGWEFDALPGYFDLDEDFTGDEESTCTSDVYY